jgi:7-carboxy-7-deazaguanine synthase
VSDETFPYSEIFYSIQGEGQFTGVPTVWLRYFGCNLQCNGFGQTDPTDPSTYELPYKDFDVNSVTKVEDLPVWSKGCDSSYSWSALYKHLIPNEHPAVIAGKLIAQTPTNCFEAPYGGVHLCFTGGEPMLPRSQRCTERIWDELKYYGPVPEGVTFETNGTKPIIEEHLKEMMYDTCILFSVSPKLWTVSGEKNEKAIRPDIVRNYAAMGDVQLKFVMGNDDRQWEELLRVVDQFGEVGIQENIWVMPVGATMESQDEIAGVVASRAIKYGFKVSARVHCYLWGNVIGV